MVSDFLDTIKQQYQQAAAYEKAIYRIEVNGIDISQYLQNRLISLRINDHRGLVADSLDIELSDTDGQLDIPPEQAEIRAWIGWESTGLVFKGSYQVTGTSHSGPPDKISIAAEAADLSEGLRQKRERTWHMIALGDIITNIAIEYSLTPQIHDSLYDQEIAHIDQNESDANLITRLADEHDAIATVKNGYLLFMPRGAAQSASGLDLPVIYLHRRNGDSHSYRSGDGTDRIDGVKAFYYDTDKGLKKHVIVGIDEGGNCKELRYTCRDKQSAELAANAEFNRSKRAAKSFSMTLARGNPNIIPEQQIIVEGFKPSINEIVWLGTTISHNLDANDGYTTDIECEIQLPNADDISELFDGSIEKEDIDYSQYTGVIAIYKDKNGKQQNFNLGDQSKPLTLKHVYGTETTAQNAAYREYNRIREANNQPLVEKPKKEKKATLTRAEKAARLKNKYASYSGVKTWYKGSNGKDQVVTLGGQSKPLIKEHLYVTKKSADAWAKREYQKIQNAKK
ncbi:contractile injection system protein, VgrG/Pvc8 family [Acinetobacter populi]|uniref:DNA primase n=1 Tax=Acinetobacter populi TaxID=1582270 RepID=A0A1Z9Z2K2_9GAMM|nr:contractile injection system protein, VgrG/Pvc8 family [Acinetobacter populi]OUY08718.1 hypothetical protein CAP51_03645 [Acinetobacter populi]